MKVPLREIPCDKHVELKNEFIRATVAGLPLRAALERAADDDSAGHADAELSFYAEGDNVFLRGTLRGWVEVACSRCVGTVRVPIDEALMVSYLPKHLVADEDTSDEEPEITEEDLDLFPYEGEEIDLEPLLKEQIVLAIPFAPLCSEGCKGLCTSCGADLNRGECGCDREVIDPRLAALKDLKV